MFTTQERETEITEAEFYDTINRNENELVVVNFFTEWHMNCIMLAPIIQDIAEEMQEITFVKINTDENPDLAGKHNIGSVPCIVIYKNGKEECRISGCSEGETILEKIKSCLAS